PEIKAHLGVSLIGPAPVEDDQCRNTDLVVLKMDGLRIACRMRRENAYLHRDRSGNYEYRGQFTIRCGRPNGTKTELSKIIEGWGDYFFYGFGGEHGVLLDWHLLDLKVFRYWHSTYLLEHGKAPRI